MSSVGTLLARIPKAFFARISLGALSLLALALIAPPPSAFAQTAADIQSQIDQHTAAISQLQAEIAQYQKTLDLLGAQHQTLQTAISSIDVSRKQTQAQVTLTQNRIAATDGVIAQIGSDISTKQQLISIDQRTVARSIRDLQEEEDQTLIEQVLASDSLADAWTAADQSAAVSAALKQNVDQLNGDKVQLAVKQDAETQTRNELASLRGQLLDQQRQLDASKSAKAQLLSQTKNQESSYQRLIAQKKAEEASFEADIYQLSQQLHPADTSKAPAPTHGILSWPLASIRITQLFGKTTDSGRLYASGTHNGVDFGASLGTPVHAALTGTVWQINQGVVQNCQYGKWVLIKHANGLATLYAHLSEIDVTPGQTVTTGQTIGLSGMTGYATGPHLHLTVYNASSVTFKNYTCHSGGVAYIPIVPTNGYLDPLAYLPGS